MNRTRKELHDEYYANIQKIQALEKANLELRRDELLLSDDFQQFTEQLEPAQYREKRKLIKTEKLIGRIHWKTDFKDEDTDEVITVNRTEIVRVDGIWQNPKLRAYFNPEITCKS